MSGIIQTSTLNCTENAVSTFSLLGVPMATATLFTKTFTAAANHIFKKAPSINLNSVADKNSYTVVVNDTGSIAGGNLTVRSFVVKYKYPLKAVSADAITFIARAELDIANSVGKIYNYNFNDNWVTYRGESRLLTIYGDESDANNPAATLTLDFKRGSTSIRVAPDGSTGSGTVTIPQGGVYEEVITFPSRTANTSYSLVLTQIANNSFLSLPTPKTIPINQYIDPTTEIKITETGTDFLVLGDLISFKGEPFSNPDKDASFLWYITTQSDAAPLKYVGTFDRSDFSGANFRNGTKRLPGGTILDFNALSVEIYPTLTGVTAGATTGTAITLTSATSVIKGMRVTGSGITHTGENSTIVTAASGTSVTLSKSSTIASGTTLTFHSVAEVYGQVTFKTIGTVDRIGNNACILNAANIIGINQAPTPTFTDPITISAEEASNYTTFIPTATDPEGDTITFKVTVMPQHGQFRYTDTQNNLQTIACSGQTLSSNNTLHATNKNLQYLPGDGNSQNTAFQYTVEDAHHPAVSTTVAINISAG